MYIILDNVMNHGRMGKEPEYLWYPDGNKQTPCAFVTMKNAKVTAFLCRTPARLQSIL